MSFVYEFKISEQKTISIKITRSFRKKNITLRSDIKNHGFVLSIPALITNKRAIDFIHKHHTWIIKHHASLPIIEQKFLSGEKVLFLGEEYIILHSGMLRGITYLNDKKIIVSGSETNTKNKIIQFFKDELDKIARELIKAHAHSMKIKISKLDIRNTTSRWGSCSSNGRVMLSLKLIMCPYDIIEYVIVHELCHLFEMNHSKKFWQLVSKNFPDYKNAEKWLKKEGKRIPTL
jgi:predicted metal-dependent hydrolase